MKECDILGERSKHSDPSYIFFGSRPQLARVYAPVTVGSAAHLMNDELRKIKSAD